MQIGPKNMVNYLVLDQPVGQLTPTATKNRAELEHLVIFLVTLAQQTHYENIIITS